MLRLTATQYRLIGFLLALMLAPAGRGFAQDAASVTFTLDFPNSDPAHYVISIFSDGRATYDSNGKLRPDVEDQDTFHLDFKVSATTQSRVFEFAKKAKYFQGDIDSRTKNIAFTGTKILAYKDGQQATQRTYNYSSNQAVQQLTQLFQNLSTTLEFGHRLEYYHKYQKLGLDEELKRMQDVAKSNGLVEVEAIAPILKQIMTDTTVLNPDRAIAQRLLIEGGATQ